jgi:(1->4)-alpha-D-glucan 1-alpha-D-glucosylmutase
MRSPLATYRLQIQPAFPFDAVAQIADYLAELGVTHLYSSPVLQAMPGSTHGYDIIDHHKPNEELGGWSGHERVCQALAENHLGQVLDIVPNHMSVASAKNHWWWDVLENGQASRYAAYFDVDWNPAEERLQEVVVLPVLDDHFGRVVERFEIRLVRRGGQFVFEYRERTFPAAPPSLCDLLQAAADRIGSDELSFLADAYRRLPRSTATDRRSVNLRHRDKEVLRRLLDRLCHEQPSVGQAIDEVVTGLNSNPVEMGKLLDRQNYRLTFWRTAGEELPYRRFFDISTLASLRMEDEQVFADSHWLVFDWIDRGLVDGLRIDHPDGLLDPEEYLARVRKRVPQAWLVVEKILEPSEELPASWPVQGTTGYDFLNRLTGVLIDPAGELPLSDFYQQFSGQHESYEEVVYQKKQQVLRESFATDVHRLTSLAVRLCERHTRYRDYTRHELRGVLREIIACFPVYRTYVRPLAASISQADARSVETAISRAKERRPEIDRELFQFMKDLLELKLSGDIEAEFVQRFQQVTGPATAKGVEDTAYYHFYRLLALNEVGGNPGRFSIPLEEFHAACLQTQHRWPLTMTTTTTHDTKRSEDVRARLAVLSEMPELWREQVERWAEHNRQHKRGDVPERNLEYALYQTLVGAWPLTLERTVEFATKAIREAKLHTSWTEPKAEYEEAVQSFVERLFADAWFQSQLESCVRKLMVPGRINSLTQALVKLTAPGVPDIYQGNELWDLTLVDPDNRRPVDFKLRRQLLQEVVHLSPEEILERSDEGLPKLWVTRQALHVRRDRPECFGPEGNYTPLVACGARADCVLAFQRGGDCVVMAPLRPAKSMPDWRDTAIELADGTWTNALTGESCPSGRINVARLLARFPVALLTRGDDADRTSS